MLSLPAMATERRLVFGEVADLYDRHRPTYPDAVIDDLAALVDGDARALEVGAGTGKATRLMAARAVNVVAVEPSPEMARIARSTCAALPGVTVVESDFEAFDPAGETFGLLYSAQAWHWIDPARRYGLARAVLAPGATLAVFWNRPAWTDSPLRTALSAVYRTIAPAMVTHGPLHPDNPSPDREIDEGWDTDIAAAAGLADPQALQYRWSLDYDADSFAGMLATVSEVRLLDPGTRGRLLDGVRATIAAHGDSLAMPMVTRLYLARAV